MKFYIHVRNEEIFFNVRARSFETAYAEVDRILDYLGWEHDFEVTLTPKADFPDFQLRVNRAGQLKGAFYDAVFDRIIYDKQVKGLGY